jgi:hypothetical protein
MPAARWSWRNLIVNHLTEHDAVETAVRATA